MSFLGRLFRDLWDDPDDDWDLDVRLEAFPFDWVNVTVNGEIVARGQFPGRANQVLDMLVATLEAVAEGSDGAMGIQVKPG